VPLHGDDMSACEEQRRGQRAAPCADVEHQLTRSDTCPGNDSGCPFVSEPVPSPRRFRSGPTLRPTGPAPRLPGHGAP
jgi:hypothetical protein